MMANIIGILFTYQSFVKLVRIEGRIGYMLNRLSKSARAAILSCILFVSGHLVLFFGYVNSYYLTSEIVASSPKAISIGYATYYKAIVAIIAVFGLSTILLSILLFGILFFNWLNKK